MNYLAEVVISEADACYEKLYEDEIKELEAKIQSLEAQVKTNDVEEDVSYCPGCQQMTHGDATCTKCGAGKIKL